MTRYLFGFLCVCALGVMPLVGCSDTGGDGGSGGAAGSGGSGGTGGMPECQSPEDCDDANDCTGNACTDGMCEHTPLANGATCDESNECTTGTCADGECDTTSLADGTACGNGAGTCEAGSCVGVFACTEQGIRDAIAVGGGPHTFDCNGPTTVVTVAEIVIDNNVILDGEGKLTVDGGGGHADPLDDHRVFQVPEGVSATLDGLAVSEGFGSWFDYKQFGAGIWNAGTLTLTNSTVLGNTAVTIGGGIYNVGTLTLVNSTVSGNVANSGGGILSEVGTLTLTNSTVSGNTVEGGCGEGICGAGGIWNFGTLTITNSTVSGNTGGGIWNMNDSVARVMSSTVSGNGHDNVFIQDSGYHVHEQRGRRWVHFSTAPSPTATISKAQATPAASTNRPTRSTYQETRCSDRYRTTADRQ